MPLPAPDMDSCCKKVCCKNGKGIYNSCDPCQGNGTFNPETCDCEQPGNPYIYVSGFSDNCICNYSSEGWVQYKPTTDAMWFRPTSVVVQQQQGDYDCNDGYAYVPGLLYIVTWSDGNILFIGGIGQGYSSNHIVKRELVAWDWSPVTPESLSQFTQYIDC